MSYLHYLSLLVIVVSNKYCIVHLFCFSSSYVPYFVVDLDCHFRLPFRYTLTFIQLHRGEWKDLDMLMNTEE
jgi:hypothetical protein